MARTDSTIDIDRWILRKVKAKEGKESIPRWWYPLSSYLVRKKSLFLGKTNSGKGSSVLYLANKMIGKNNPVTLLNSDIDQSGLGLPGAISLEHF